MLGRGILADENFQLFAERILKHLSVLENFQQNNALCFLPTIIYLPTADSARETDLIYS